MTQKLKHALRFSPTLVIALPLIVGASMKIAGTTQMQNNFLKVGLLPLMPWIGLVELSSVLLFIFPKTTRVGLMLLTAHLCGAIAVELTSGGPFLVPAILLALVWTASSLRHPEFFIRSYPSFKTPVTNH